MVGKLKLGHNEVRIQIDQLGPYPYVGSTSPLTQLIGGNWNGPTS